MDHLTNEDIDYLDPFVSDQEFQTRCEKVLSDHNGNSVIQKILELIKEMRSAMLQAGLLNCASSEEIN